MLIFQRKQIYLKNKGKKRLIYFLTNDISGELCTKPLCDEKIMQWLQQKF